MLCTLLTELSTSKGPTRVKDKTVFSKYYEFIEDVLAQGNGVSDE